MTTIGTLERLSPASLSELILADQEATAARAAAGGSGDPAIAIIDVRDDDYIGGHIKGAQNFPSHSLETMFPTLVRLLQDKETVVFHCALSQQRGPSAALKYIRERERLLATRAKSAAAAGASEEATAAEKKLLAQKVFVLDRGFVGWQEVYGEDERLTEGYSKELWQDGYWG
ncbi:Rhodanese-like domain-containing protein [Bombardia bombarda]|uniref:Rhodanese-like domain-containing protein n=1 Tax=Bombardia bombarda TaxID=252184 RepID=A0AA40CH81_9PEZI|nr:Rhodanese-like domain-containing protein [Bombardia bombarda]